MTRSSDNARWKARRNASAPLWGAVLLSGGAWSVHLIFSHFLVEGVCAQVATAGATAEPTVWLPLLIVSAATVVVALAGAAYAWTMRRRIGRRGPGLERAAGLAPVVTALALFFAVAIAVETLPLLIVGCGIP